MLSNISKYFRDLKIEVYFLSLLVLTVQNFDIVHSRPGVFEEGLRALLPNILQSSPVDFSFSSEHLSGEETIFAIPDPDFSPIIVLLGEDNNNQSAVVVLGDEDGNENDEYKEEDLPAVIGQVISNLSPSPSNINKDERNFFTQLLKSTDDAPVIVDSLPDFLINKNNPEETDRSLRGIDINEEPNNVRKISREGLKDAELNENISINSSNSEENDNPNGEQYFDPDFDESIKFLGPKMQVETKTSEAKTINISIENSPLNDVSSILSNDDNDDDDDDQAIINKEEISNSLRSRAMKAYTSTKSFRPSFNPPKGLSIDQGRRSRRA